jgi:transposase IS4-like protein/DDE family transposase
MGCLDATAAPGASLSTDSAICLLVPSIAATAPDVLDAVGLEEERRGRLRDVALAGPAAGLESPLGMSERAGVFQRLAGAGDIEHALAEVGHVDQRVRALPGSVTAAVVLGLALYSGEGYAGVLAKTFGQLAGGTRLPGEVPTANALSKARVRLDEAPLRALFQASAAAGPAPGAGSFAFGLELTAFDGTTLELAGEEALCAQFGVPTGGPRPLARVVTLVSVGSRRVVAAAIGGYHDSEQELCDRLAPDLRPGTLNLADRNFYSMRRWIAFAATGAHLLWRVKDGKCFPARVIEDLPDGSALVRLRESDGMRAKRGRDLGDAAVERLPDTIARLVEFDVHMVDAAGRRRTSRLRILTTLLDYEAFSATDLAGCYAERWQVEIAYLRLKTTLRGPGVRMRGHTPALVRQEIWAFLIVYNAMCDLAAEVAAMEGIDPDEISFVAVLRIVRDAVAGAATPCRNCGNPGPGGPDALTGAITAAPRNRTGRNRTSPRTARQRQTGHGSKATYTIEIVTSNLPKTDD